MQNSNIYRETPYLPNGYKIGLDGVIVSHKGKILKQSISNSGYWFVNIRNKGYFTHRALAFAFIDRKEGCDFVNHKDGNKMNNQIDNLEWVTKSYNLKHAYDKGLKVQSVGDLYRGSFGEKHNRSKKVLCRETYMVFGSMSEAERHYNLGGGSVSLSIKKKKAVKGMHFEVI